MTEHVVLTINTAERNMVAAFLGLYKRSVELEEKKWALYMGDRAAAADGKPVDGEKKPDGEEEAP